MIKYRLKAEKNAIKNITVKNKEDISLEEIYKEKNENATKRSNENGLYFEACLYYYYFINLICSKWIFKLQKIAKETRKKIAKNYH